MLKVIDFGLAKSAVLGARDASLTVGGFVGTPHFASPEQLEEKDLDIRSDIYSLGATLWYLLTGQTLYSGSLARVMIGHISETPPFDRLIAPPALRALLRRMLAKNPADRPQTPDALLTEIRAVASQVADPQLICRLEPVAFGAGCGFTLQELLRVRRFLPLPEALPLLRKIVEALDSVDAAGRAQVDLTVQAVALDFPEQSTTLASDLLRQTVAQWPPFGLKFRDSAPTVVDEPDAVGDQATLFVAPATPRDEGYLQRVAGIASELLGGRLRAENSAPPTEFAPLAALTEEGNGVLQAALAARSPAAYGSGAEFLDALQKAEGVEAVVLAAAPAKEVATLARTMRITSAELPRRPRRSRTPRVVLAALALVVVGGAAAAIFFFNPEFFLADDDAKAPSRKPVTVAPKSLMAELVTPPATPAAATPAPEPAAVPEPATPPPPPPAPLDPDQQIKLAIGESAEYEAAADWKSALSSAVHLVRDFPTYEKGPARLEDLIGRLGAKGEFTRHWPTYEPVLQEASDLGSGHATFLLGQAIKKEDPSRALSLFRKAADLGVREAMTEVGLAYFHGDSVTKDVAEAERWFQKASDHGDPAGMLTLGECYLSGTGVKQDNARALKLIQEAADHGSGDARNLLGKLYLYGRAGLTMSKPTALEYFRLAKEAKCPEAFYNLGMLAYTAKGPFNSPARAATLFEGGAKLGHPLSMFYYARCLDQGTGVVKSTSDAQSWYGKAIGSLKKEAEGGSRAAMLCYAMACDEGLGIDKNSAEAKRWYIKAASLGDTIAEQWCFQNRVGFPIPASGLSTSTITVPRKGFGGKRVPTPLP
jgi:TPR repeat protein